MRVLLTLSGMLFCNSLSERCCEQELGCDELPPGLCGPSMGRVAPRFRKACEKFPVVAENIVRANGLEAEEFNR